MKRNIILARGCCSIYRKKEREGNFIMQSVSCARGPGFDPCRRRGKFVGLITCLPSCHLQELHDKSVRRPSDRDVNWRPPVQGQSSPVQVKDPYTGSILMHVGSSCKTHRSVQCTSPKNNQKLIDGSNRKTKQNKL